MLTLLFLSFGVFALVMLGMTLGFIFQGKCLRGSCGGGAVIGPDGEDLRCDACPNRKAEESERKQASAS